MATTNYLKMITVLIFLLIPIELLIHGAIASTHLSYLYLGLPILLFVCIYSFAKCIIISTTDCVMIHNDLRYFYLNEMIERIAYQLNLSIPQIYISKGIPSHFILNGSKLNSSKGTLVISENLLNTMSQSEKIILLTHSMVGLKQGLPSLELFLLTWELIFFKICGFLIFFSRLFRRLVGSLTPYTLRQKKTTFSSVDWTIWLLLFEIPLTAIRKIMVTEKIIEKIDLITIQFTKDPLGLSSTLDKIAIYNNKKPIRERFYFSQMTPSLEIQSIISLILNTQEHWLKRKERLNRIHAQFPYN